MRKPAGIPIAALWCSLVLAAGCRSAVATGVPRQSATTYDIVITNGRIVDGTGNAWFWGDIAVRDGRIARITPRGLLAAANAARHIDAAGQVVAPGFIDIQAQSYDNFMTGDGRALSMVTQGITTAILGEGNTPAPVNDKMLAALTDTAGRRLASRFTGPHGFSAWLDFMVARGVSENVGSFVGSGTVRAYSKGESLTPLTATERDTVYAMVGRVMQDGAFTLRARSNIRWTTSIQPMTSSGPPRQWRHTVGCTSRTCVPRGKRCSRQLMRPSISATRRAYRWRSIT